MEREFEMPKVTPMSDMHYAAHRMMMDQIKAELLQLPKPETDKDNEPEIRLQ